MSDDVRPDGPATDPRDLIWGEHKAAIDRRLERLDPDLAAYVRDFAYGTLYARGTLEPRLQELLAVSMLAALGSPPEIRTHLRGALNAGVTERELRETILFSIAFLGFPRAIAAMEALSVVLRDRPGEGGPH